VTLKETLIAALETLGADAARFQFDDHSTIAMAFNDVGEIFLDPQPNERVWLWGMMEPASPDVRHALAAPLLEEILRPVEHWESGALTVCDNGRVGGLLHPDCVADPEQLAVALQDFHQCLVRVQSIK
jgi:hypothetical protein